MMNQILFAIIILIAISKDADCQALPLMKVGDSVDLDEMRIYCHRRIARHVGSDAPDFSCMLPSGKILTKAGTKGKVQVFVIWEPSDPGNREMLPAGHKSTMLCPIQELASKDTNLIFLSIVTDTTGLAIKNRPCPSGTIQYALTTVPVRRALQFGLGYPIILIIGKDGTLKNAVCGFDLIFYDDKAYADLAMSVRKMLSL